MASVAQAKDDPPVGIAANWPTVSGIDAAIETSATSNYEQPNPLKGMGYQFIIFGNEYGINPGVIVAIMQRESQLGTDGSILPTKCNNFSGITAGDNGATCKPASGIAGREWRKYNNVTDGIRGTFELLNSDLYRSTNGTLGAVMEKYAPRFENDHGSMFMTFAATASRMGITITEQTNIYTDAGGTPTFKTNSGGSGWNPIDKAVGAMADWLLGGIMLMLFRATLVIGGLILGYLAVKRLI